MHVNWYKTTHAWPTQNYIGDERETSKFYNGRLQLLSYKFTSIVNRLKNQSKSLHCKLILLLQHRKILFTVLDFSHNLRRNVSILY